jgi:CPA2 family monovalent cation:H+ antiporter-2
MPHDTPLISTIVIGLCLAFLLGALAQRFRISPLVGYLLAGVAVGPYTPGFVADQALAHELAEIGVILLMFGVGLHFSLKDLWSVRTIAVPGAIAQIGVATLFGAVFGMALGWPIGAGIIFGLALSVASTVVLLRALEERQLIGCERGRIAVGWLIVEDIVMILALVLLPALGPLLSGGDAAAAQSFGFWDIVTITFLTLGKVGAFIAFMLMVGRKVIPWLLDYVAKSGSRELFRLAVLAIALGVAYAAAELFGVSFALGAFFAGMILSESALSQQAASETLPLRDAFAVLFFVSVGMLFDPSILVREPALVVLTVLIIVVIKSLAALAIVLAFRRPLSTALTIAASLAQIGEFSFILVGLGISLGPLPELGRELVLAGAIVSILFNPLLFMALDRLEPWLARREGRADGTTLVPSQQRGHTVLVGGGRIGHWVADELERLGVPFLVIDQSDEVVDKLKARNIEALAGSGIAALNAANLEHARALLITIPDGFEAGRIAAKARAANDGLSIVARARTDAEAEHLTKNGADFVVRGARKVADAIVEGLAAQSAR